MVKAVIVDSSVEKGHNEKLEVKCVMHDTETTNNTSDTFSFSFNNKAQMEKFIKAVEKNSFSFKEISRLFSIKEKLINPLKKDVA